MDFLKTKANKLPEKPGVYIMKDSDKNIIYIGKAKILKRRVSQYFLSSKKHSEKIKAMVSNIKDFEYIVIDGNSTDNTVSIENPYLTANSKVIFCFG